MNEIVNVKVHYSLGEIQQNLKEVAASVRKYCDDFKGVVVTEDTVADGKQMLANIRKEKKYLDDQRKEIKKAWNAPYLEFEKQVKEVTALYDEPINMINGQIQELEEQRKAKKERPSMRSGKRQQYQKSCKDGSLCLNYTIRAGRMQPSRKRISSRRSPIRWPC